MDFRELYQEPAIESKRQEFRWYHERERRPPFLQRNLLYARRVKEKRPSAQRDTARAGQESSRKNKTLDLFSECFQHGTDSRHVAPLATSTKQNALAVDENTNPWEESPETAKKKRKLNKAADKDVEDSSGEPVLLEPEQIPQTWKANANGKEDIPFVASSRRLSMSTLSSSDDNESVSPISRTTPPTMEQQDKGSDEYISTTITRRKPRVFFHYHFLDSNGRPCSHVEEVYYCQCPFCSHEAVSDTSLLAHCTATHTLGTATHGLNLTFDAVRSEIGVLHIMVQSDSGPVQPSDEEQSKDFIYVASQKSLPETPFVTRPVWKVAAMSIAARKKKIRLLQQMGASEETTKQFTPDDTAPIRQYYRSRNLQPMIGKDWDVDSDEDSRGDEWRHELSASMLEDFEDVSSKEKLFLNLWNEYITSHSITPDHAIPGKCMDFVRTHISYLQHNGLREQLLSHMMSLWDSGLVSSSHILKCMEVYDSPAGTETGSKKDS